MADVVVTMESDVARLIRDQEKVIRKQSDMIDALKKTQRAGKDAGDTGTKAAKDTESGWSRASASIATTITRYGGMATAVGLVTNALARMQQQEQKAMDSFDRLAESSRRLRSIAESSEDLAGMFARRDTLASRYGVSREAAADIIFQQRSLGMSDADAEALARGSLVIDPALAAQVGGQLPRLFPGSGLTPMRGVDLLVRAAQQSKADPAEMAQAFPSAAAGLGATGATPEETGAALAMLAVRLKSTLTASERLGTFGSALALSEEFGGRGLIGGMEALQAATPEKREGFLGKSKELNEAYRLLTEEMERIREQRDLLAQSAGALERQLSFVEPGARASQQAKAQAASREALAESQMVTGGFERQAALDRAMESVMRAVPNDALSQLVAETVGRVMVWARADPVNVETATRFFGGGNFQEMLAELKQIRMNQERSTPEQSLKLQSRQAASVPQE